MAREFRPKTWPYDHPFKRADRPDRIFERTSFKETFDLCERDWLLENDYAETLFRDDFFSKEPEVHCIMNFCAVCSDPEYFTKILGSLQVYTEDDAKFLFMAVHFMKLILEWGIVDMNPDMREAFSRVYRGTLIHTQRIARTMPEYHIFRVKREGSVEEAVRLMLIDDDLPEAGLMDDIFEGLNFFE